jgi:hypothetical protein
MYVRLVEFTLGSGKRSTAQTIADKVIPAIRKQPGCERAEFFADGVAGEYGLIVLWESKQAAERAASEITPLLVPAITAAGGMPNIRLYEVYEPKAVTTV